MGQGRPQTPVVPSAAGRHAVLAACLCVWEGGPSALVEQEASGGRLRCWVPMPCLKPYRGIHTVKAVRQGEERGLPVSFDLAKLQLLVHFPLAHHIATHLAARTYGHCEQ